MELLPLFVGVRSSLVGPLDLTANLLAGPKSAQSSLTSESDESQERRDDAPCLRISTSTPSWPRIRRVSPVLSVADTSHDRTEAALHFPARSAQSRPSRRHWLAACSSPLHLYLHSLTSTRRFAKGRRSSCRTGSDSTSLASQNSGYSVVIPQYTLTKYSDFIRIALPKPYTSRVRNALAASAKSVALKSLGGGPFFASGVSLETSIDDPRLKATLHTAFRSRLPEVFDQSQHYTSSSTAEDPQAAAFVAGMDDWERELLATGEGSTRAMRSWAAPRKRGAGTG